MGSLHEGCGQQETAGGSSFCTIKIKTMSISEKRIEKAIENIIEHTVEQEVEHRIEQTAEREVDHRIEQTAEGKSGRETEHPVEQKIEHAAEQTAGKYEKTGQAMEELQETVARLRAPDGCPWDRAQDHLSLKAACVEEAAEVVSGINILAQTGRAHCLKEELGDLLLQVVMHAQIAEEEGLFTMEDVIRGINEKMLRRHPHVFGEESLKYLPEEYVRHLQEKAAQRASDARLKACDPGQDKDCGQDPESRREAQRGSSALLADWKEIKSYEKSGREWEEEYLFRAFDEAEELIGVARKRKLEKKS